MINPNTPNQIAAEYEERLSAMREQLAECRRNTLLEAIDLARGETWANHSAYVVLEKLRRMAGVE